jgi:hypothetical protein
MTTNSKRTLIITTIFPKKYKHQWIQSSKNAKIEEYMKLFGSGINFYGGPGESAHKQLIKIPGQRTQHRVSEFAQQTALQYYNMLVSSHTAHDCQVRSNSYKQSGNTGTDFDCTET